MINDARLEQQLFGLWPSVKPEFQQHHGRIFRIFLYWNWSSELICTLASIFMMVKLQKTPKTFHDGMNDSRQVRAALTYLWKFRSEPNMASAVFWAYCCVQWTKLRWILNTPTLLQRTWRVLTCNNKFFMFQILCRWLPLGASWTLDQDRGLWNLESNRFLADIIFVFIGH